MITVYSKPNCAQCIATQKFLDNKGLEYKKVDVSEDTEAFNKVKNLGYQSLPVVEVSNDLHWSGFRPDKISTIS